MSIILFIWGFFTCYIWFKAFDYKLEKSISSPSWEIIIAGSSTALAVILFVAWFVNNFNVLKTL